MSNISLTAIVSQSILKSYPFNPFFFKLALEKSFKTFPKHNGIELLSESYNLRG